ncbi:MAG: hypothetical protein WCG91_04420 [Candidatus Shapirobacteria bacterium]
MTNHDRNMRTLIVCSVMALFVLVPLKFVEIGQYSVANSDSEAVLGAVAEESVVLPEVISEEEVIPEEEAVLGATTENTCFSQSIVEGQVAVLEDRLDDEDVTQEVADAIDLKIKEVIANLCEE